MNYYWLIWAAVFLAVAFFIWNLHIFVSVVYLKKLENHSLGVSVSLFNRLKLYTFQISPLDFFRDGALAFKPVDNETGGAPAEKRLNPPPGESNFNSYPRLLGKLTKHLYFDKIYLRLIYGFEDAALTGVSSGFLAALRGVFLAVCNAYFKMRKAPDISVYPVYGRERLEVEFNCIFSIRLGKVIAIAASTLIGYCNIFKKNQKFIQGGEIRWRNILFRT